MLPILRICDSCTFYREADNSCKAFPDGIPLRSSDTHFEVLPGQTGEYIYDMDPSLVEELDAYRIIHPEVRFPIIITYDVPEDGEVLNQEDVPLEEVEEEDEEDELDE